MIAWLYVGYMCRRSCGICLSDVGMQLSDIMRIRLALLHSAWLFSKHRRQKAIAISVHILYSPRRELETAFSR